MDEATYDAMKSRQALERIAAALERGNELLESIRDKMPDVDNQGRIYVVTHVP